MALSNFAPVLQKLARSRNALISATDGIRTEDWSKRPGEGQWSAAEVVAHVMMVEQTVIAAAERILKKQPKPISFLGRLHLPIAMTERRVVRLKSPIPVSPELLGEKDAMLLELNRVREQTVALAKENASRDLRAYCWKHPFLGSLNPYEWLSFIASHEIRHEKQVREIAKNLPKPVAPFQK